MGVEVLKFLLAGVLGALITSVLRRRTRAEETKISLHEARYTEETKFLDELSELIGRRFFLLQRMLWAIEDGDPKAIDKAEKLSYVQLENWNANLV